MRTPPVVHPGDRVAVVAPAGPIHEERFAKGLKWLEERFEVVSVPVARSDGYLAGSDEERRKELQTALDRPDTAMVIAARGGYGVMRLLGSLDYRGLVSHPKLVVGCSDVTVLLCDLAARAGIASVHGPMVETLADASEDSRAGLMETLRGEPRDIGNLEVLAPGEAVGPLLGGNLTLLSHLAGTPHLPSLDGSVLFLEDVDEKPYRIDRALTHLRLARLLDNVAAVLLGDFTHCDDPDHDGDPTSAVLSALHGLRVPILSGLPVGHGNRNRALPFGLACKVSAPRAGPGMAAFGIS